MEVHNLLSFLGLAKANTQAAKNTITISRIFLNLETTNHMEWSEEKIKQKLAKHKQMYLKGFEKMVAEVA